MLEATEFQGPVNYRYRDLVSATASFSEANKLGEGGFGDIYKVKSVICTMHNDITASMKMSLNLYMMLLNREHLIMEKQWQ